MPVVIVRINEGTSKEQKRRVIAGITEVLKLEMGKNPETTHVVIEEIPLDCWGLRGKTVEDIRAGK